MLSPFIQATNLERVVLSRCEYRHPGTESDTHFAAAADSNQQHMTLRLAENTVDAQNVVEDIVEEDQWHVQFLFVKHAKSGFGEFAQLFAVDRNVVLGRPVGEQNRTR